MPPRPRSLAETLAELERSPRLAGIGRLVSRLEGAISLPPRRLAWSELQDGGYSDITTKGAPEQILPIQFALEGEEFLRRFAERELLYFYREEPRQPTTEEIILLLDQGARTWGDVRLVLAGAALALARQAERRRIAIKLAVTSNDAEAVDPAQLEPRALGELLEASDLSAHPGQALARLRDYPSGVAARHRPLDPSPKPGGPGSRGGGAVAGRGGRCPAVRDLGRLEGPARAGGVAARVAGRAGAQPDRPRAGRITRRRRHQTRPDRPILMVWKGSFESIGFPFHTGALDQLESNCASRPLELRL